jgi:predicted ATP-dependent serine protease
MSEQRTGSKDQVRLKESVRSLGKISKRILEARNAGYTDLMMPMRELELMIMIVGLSYQRLYDQTKNDLWEKALREGVEEGLLG